LAIITASILAASAVLNNAPIFPGFSGDSTTNIRGFLDAIFKLFKLSLFACATAITPSVVSL